MLEQRLHHLSIMSREIYISSLSSYEEAVGDYAPNSAGKNTSGSSLLTMKPGVMLLSNLQHVQVSENGSSVVISFLALNKYSLLFCVCYS